MAGPLFFSTIDVSRQIFFRSARSFAIVNLKPLVPGHVLVIPNRVVPRLSDLDEHELSSLMSSIQRVGSVIEKAYAGDALTVACQDGKAAGQSIAHVHFHLIPRKMMGDTFAENRDAIYPELEKAEHSLPSQFQNLKMDADEDRIARSMEEMEKEAAWLKTLFDGA